uniref:Uncharacterized protein n=1 Tax=Trichobilharzia regenti TaxID=157069 RepID=A0AA85K605_TRIRE|nr:unnamed protein product [Trichobilharzia regenti]
MSYESEMEKTLQKLNDVIQLRQQLLQERATLKYQLDKLLQRSVDNANDDVEDVGGDGDEGGDGGRFANDDDDDVDRGDSSMLHAKQNWCVTSTNLTFNQLWSSVEEGFRELN